MFIDSQDGLGNPAIVAAASDPENQKAAASVVKKIESLAPKYENYLKRAWRNTGGKLTGDTQQDTRRANKMKAQAKGMAYVSETRPLYNSCFGVSDWFQPGAPPRPNPSKSNPADCCKLLTVYDAAVQANAFKVGREYSFAARFNDMVINDRVNPRPYFDKRYGGAPGTYFTDLPRRGNVTQRNFGKDSNIGCRATPNIPFLAFDLKPQPNIPVLPIIKPLPGKSSARTDTQLRLESAPTEEDKKTGAMIAVVGLVVAGITVYFTLKGK